MEKLVKAALTMREIKFRMDDDYVDRLNRQTAPPVKSFQHSGAMETTD